MKKTLLFGITLLVWGCKFTEQTDEGVSNREAVKAYEEVQKRAEKHGIKITKSTPEQAKNGVIVVKSPEEYKALVDDLIKKKQEAEEINKQVLALSEEMKVLMKNGGGGPTDYFNTLQKYPLVYAQTIQQYGGKEGFEKYRKTLLMKEETQKSLKTLN